MLKKQADFESKSFQKKLDHKDLGDAVLEEVQTIATETQKPIVERLTKWNLQYKSYYVQNCIIIDNATPEQIYILAGLPEVEKIMSNNHFKVPLEESREPIQKSNPSGPLNIEWNIKFVKADQVWAKGIDGKG